MIKIAICDGEEVFLNQIYGAADKFFKNEAISFEADLFHSGEEFIQSLENEIEYDLALLDIKMYTAGSTEIGAILRNKFNHIKTLFIYISSLDSWTKEMVHFNAVRVLSKPIVPQLFDEALYHSCYLMKTLEKQTFSFKDTNKTQITIPLKDIIYFETQKNHRLCIITTVQNHICFGKMIDLEAQFVHAEFLRIHQAYLINYDYIKDIDYNKVTMKNGIPLFISRSRKKEIQKQYLQIREKRARYWQ